MSDIKIEWVDVADIKPNPKNRNTHPPEQIDEFIRQFKYQGFRQPLIVSNQSKLLVVGHGRLIAAKKMGLTKVPVSYQDFSDSDMERSFAVADNGLAQWSSLDLAGVNLDIPDFDPNFDIKLLGIKDFALDPSEKYQDKDADALPNMNTNELGVKIGDLYQLGGHRLMCGDSCDLEQVKLLMDGNLADLWIADPPFGVSYMEKNAAVHGGIVKNAVGKEIKSDTMSVDELKPLWLSAAKCAYQVTTDKAANYWCACQGSDKMMMMMMMMMDEAGWNIRHELIWVKSSFVFGRSDYHYRHEPIIYGWKKEGTHEFYGDRKHDSVLEIDRPNKSDMHPTTKPVELFSTFIANSTKSGQRVFESFGGSGTTLIACTKLSRVSNTMEIDPHYCSVIIKRWQDFTGEKAVKIREGDEIAAS